MQYYLVGLGDLIAVWLAYFGIHPVVGTCGCDKRRKFLNQFQVAILA